MPREARLEVTFAPTTFRLVLEGPATVDTVRQAFATDEGVALLERAVQLGKLRVTHVQEIGPTVIKLAENEP